LASTWWIVNFTTSRGARDLQRHGRHLIHETQSLSNILFIRRKFFTCKMQEGEDLLDHINKVKALADQLACLEVPVRDEDVVMTLLQSLPPS
jgi:gluconate kinase